MAEETAEGRIVAGLRQVAEAEGVNALARRLGVGAALLSHTMSGRIRLGQRLAHAARLVVREQDVVLFLAYELPERNARLRRLNTGA